jgi:hypothetical protein
MLAACGGTNDGRIQDAGEDGDADSSAHDATMHEPALAWVQREVALEPDGRTAPLTFDLTGLERPVFALRTYAADAEASRALCFQLEDVRTDNETLWVPPASSADYGDYCTRCEQPVAVGSGYGLFVLPSAAALPTSFGSVTLRVALRDCLTLTPLSPATTRPRTLLVESASLATPPRARTVTLPVAIVAATPHAFAAGARLDQAFVHVQEIWRAAGIELVLRGPFELPRPAAPVVYSASDRSALAALQREANVLTQQAGVEAAAAVIVITPCLVREDTLSQSLTQPLATTAHLPGGFGVHAEPDGIFVAGELCGGLTPGARYLESESLAALMAHELGHYLGLFHVREADGREDVLADTSQETPNLMQARPSAGATTLADSQIEIARRHIALAGPGQNRGKNASN